MIEIGAIVGIIVPNQMAAGTVGMPILMVFFILPIFSNFNKNIDYLAKFLPNYNLNLLFKKMFSGGEFGTVEDKNMAVIIIWIVIAGITFAYTYKKVGLLIISTVTHNIMKSIEKDKYKIGQTINVDGKNMQAN